MKILIYKFLKSNKAETDEKFEEIRRELHLMMQKVGGWKIKIMPKN